MTGTSPEEADWIRLNVLPLLWRDETEDLRTCLCQAPPSAWLGGIKEPAARLWSRDGLPLPWGPAGETTKFLGARHLVQVWHTDRTCTRRRPAVAPAPASA
ncbi:hypothetical protein CFC35_05600 [Streptomyces sp. FBKL.4005]|uniref:hypothetical protein n=1 Tax=Streptomyces sp. FBKL.4005 TaxID=2015515 RepID=UPI000B970576|nr:hypothetical protein [Streptomyces sp. FBKL.4005]OYP14040.1 hypothetical protein CFC35_05600 [Streptomyces sp. FBKL.4005]